MPFKFDRAAGTIYKPDGGILYVFAYSGHGDAINDPAFEMDHNIGPLPAGSYTIGKPKSPPDHLGPDALPLTPFPENKMYGRSGFFIHGDNAKHDHSASDGCIIVGPAARALIADSPDRVIEVI